RHDSERSRTPRTPHRDDNVEQRRLHLFRWIFEGDRPARCTAGDSQFVMQSEFVDLDDDAVELVLDIVTMLTEVLDELDDLVDAMTHLRMRAHRQSPGCEQVVNLTLRRHRRIGPGADAVNIQ